ncbi:hypothetical protein [Alteromonas halophila]|uniref:Uncharacterized protein n=1 Tax=Alteromonas halophila TaxID=516698 RepID=A0A918MZI6_9ALTE|nr:hypothetical protein [Alteromonas halophila]GGW87392.1 hypothetical protein GCM10007391_21650 [Alteromonas halophila]
MMKKLTVAAALFVALGTAAEEPLAITDFSVENIETLDAQGKVLATVPVSSLPDTDIPVIEKNEELDLIKIKNKQGEEVWLDAYFVKLNKGKVVDLPCYKMSETDGKDSRETGTMGFGGTCEDAN